MRPHLGAKAMISKLIQNGGDSNFWKPLTAAFNLKAVSADAAVAVDAFFLLTDTMCERAGFANRFRRCVKDVTFYTVTRPNG